MTVTSEYITKKVLKTEQGPRGFPGPPGPVSGGVYPSAGIPLSTGVAWGVSLTNNSANWNTAFGWGDHSVAGYAPLANPIFTGIVTAPSIIIEDLTDGYIPYQVVATDKLGDSPIFTDSTNVGIGTTSPDSNLEVEGTSDVGLNVKTTSTGNTGSWTKYIRSQTGATATWRTGIGIISDSNAYVIYEDAPSAGNRFVILSGGNAGFGVSVPGYPLDIQSATAQLQLKSTTGTNFVLLRLNNTGGDTFFGREKSAGGELATGSAGYSTVINSQGTDPIHIAINNAIGMTMLNGGNVGMTVTNPTVTLEVAGSGIKSEIMQSRTAYSTGFFGNGYKIIETDGETTAEFDNLIVRKLLKASTLEIDEIDVIGGSLVISPASGTAYSIEPNIGEFTSWTNSSYETFTSSGLDISSCINTGGGAALAGIAQTYDAIAGETITITGTIVLNSGTLPVIRISEDNYTASANHALANGANTIIHVVTNPGVLNIDLYANTAADCNFSFTSIEIVSDIERITFDTKSNTNPIQFKVDDYIAAQQWVNYDHTVIESYRGQVLAVCQSATLGSAYIQVTTISGAMWAGMKLAQLGNSSDAARQNLLYMTSSDGDNPFIEGHSGVSAGVFSNTTRKFRVGNLVGITDPALGLALTGYGIYSQHGYFTGISAFGTAIGLDPESVDTNNVSVVGCDIYESSRNDDTGSLYINSKGYQGGATKYRNTYIGDGKAGYLFQAVGESYFASIQKAFGFHPHIFSNDYAPTAILNVVYILSGAGASKTLTLPVAADVVSQFGAGKSATVPFIIAINQSDTYNLNITTVGNADTFWYAGVNTKTYVLASNRSIIITFVAPEWYIIET